MISCRSEFHGIFTERKEDGFNPFTSDLWLAFCRDYAAHMGLKNNTDPFANIPLHRLKHMILPHRLARSIKSIISGTIPDFETPSYLIPIINAIQTTINARGNCNVLDIGGGWGDNFLMIGRALGSEIGRLNYSIVDNDRLAELGTDLYRSCSHTPKFISDFSKVARNYDYIVICGTLPYIDDWKHFLQVCKEVGRSIYLARTAITYGQGFYTQQTVFVSDMNVGTYPYRVFGHDELQTEMNNRQIIIDKKTNDYSLPFAGLPGKIEAFYSVQLWDQCHFPANP